MLAQTETRNGHEHSLADFPAGLVAKALQAFEDMRGPTQGQKEEG